MQISAIKKCTEESKLFEFLIEFKGKGKSKTDTLVDFVRQVSSTQSDKRNDFRSASEVMVTSASNSKPKRICHKEKFSLKKQLLNQKAVTDYFKANETYNTDESNQSTFEPEVVDIDGFSVAEIAIQKQLFSRFSKNDEPSDGVVYASNDVSSTSDVTLKRKSPESETEASNVKRLKHAPQESNSKLVDLFGDDDSMKSESQICDRFAEKSKQEEGRKDRRPKVSSTKHKAKDDRIFKEKFSTKDRVRVSELVVKHLMPTYKHRKLITSKEHFKDIAREMSKHLLETKGSHTSM